MKISRLTIMMNMKYTETLQFQWITMEPSQSHGSPNYIEYFANDIPEMPIELAILLWFRTIPIQSNYFPM